jgi:DNA-directed RNA polymerase specialized sigma24 family protein
MPDLPFLSTSPRDPPDDLSPDQLAARCQNRQPDGSHEPFCLELFRRAIVESCSLCWHFVHRLYYPLARYWVTRRANLPSDDVDDLTQDAFVAFCRFYTSDRLAQAKGLGQVLRYLESCADTAVKQFWRRKKRSPVEVTLEQEVVNRHHSDASAEAAALERVTTQEIWSAIEARCQSEQERIVAWRSLVVGAKPHEIAAWHPELFPGVKDVYRVKRSLFDRLSRDPLLQAMYEKGFPEHYTR